MPASLVSGRDPLLPGRQGHSRRRCRSSRRPVP